MNYTRALVRLPGRNMAAGITTSNLGVPDVDRALQQFDAYKKALTDCGLSVTVLEPLDGFPDAHFVEDTAVIFPSRAVITRPGAPTRRGEVRSICAALNSLKPTTAIEPPGTIDGGDVLIAGTHVFIGRSERTNEQGTAQLGALVSSFGYSWTSVCVDAGLHLKSSVNVVGEKTLLTSATFSEHPAFGGFNRIVLSDEEAYAGNTLLINEHLIMPEGFPETKKKLLALNRPIIELDMSEFQKMDGGLTCLSLRF